MSLMQVNIFPALIECFGIILIGYLIARLNIISSTQGKGISLFMLHISLPALIFKSLVEVDFSIVNWRLWGGILIAKLILFVVVAIATFIFEKEEKFGKAGLYSIFVTQSNDFAFGLPILKSIFNSPNDEFLVSYVYMVAPINLALLNPIGYSMMEYEKAKKSFVDSNLGEEGESSVEKKRIKGSIYRKILLTTLKGTVTNPLIIVIIFGIAFNFLLKQKLPGLLCPFFDTVSSSFGATALFYLGWSLGNSPMQVKGFSLVIPLILVTMKGIILPIIMKTTVTWLVNTSSHSNHSLSTEELATFGFLYGAIPTAPPVVVYASKYGLPEYLVANGLVIGTILCAPILFASVQMLKVPNMKDITLFWDLTSKVSQDASIISVVCCVWVLIVLSILRFYKRKLHQNTFILFIFQLSIGIMGAFYPIYCVSKNQGVKKFSVWLLLTSLYGQCCWTAVLSFCLAFVSIRNKYFSYAMYAIGIIVPVLLSTIIVTLHSNIYLPPSPYRFFVCYKNHLSMGIIFFALNLLALVSIIVCLIKMNRSAVFEDIFKRQKRDRTHERSRLLSGHRGSESSLYGTSSGDEQYSVNSKPIPGKKTSNNSDFSGSSSSDLSSHEAVEKAEEAQLSMMGVVDSFYVTNHVICLLLVGFVSIVNLAVALWYLVSRENSGLFLELVMLAVVLTFGQGFIPLITFGFLKELFLLPMFERFHNSYWAKLKRRTFRRPDHEDLDSDVIVLCKCFMENHHEKCFKDIGTYLCLRSNRKSYKDVFTGVSLVDWLLNSGLVNDRGEGISYGDKLLLGGVIMHITHERSFYDLPYFYKFTDTCHRYAEHPDEES